MGVYYLAPSGLIEAKDFFDVPSTSVSSEDFGHTLGLVAHNFIIDPLSGDVRVILDVFFRVAGQRWSTWVKT